MIRAYILLILILLLTTIASIAHSSDIAPATVLAERLESSTRELAAWKKESVVDLATVTRDPMIPVNSTVTQVGPSSVMNQSDTIRVAGIVGSVGDFLALVNGAVYRVGDSLGEYTIRDIHEDGIDVEKAGKTSAVQLYSLNNEK
jgi:hypothetical protein